MRRKTQMKKTTRKASGGTKQKRTTKLKELSPDLLKLVETLQHLPKQALAEYSPQVEELIQTASRDKRRIEHLLDGILEFCYDGAMLALYKKLCRHYFYLDPVATAGYVYAYRDLWDVGAKGKSK